MSGSDLLAQIARVREELCAVDRELREFGGTKDHGALSEINFVVKKGRAD
jgi:hypothetical protein